MGAKIENGLVSFILGPKNAECIHFRTFAAQHAKMPLFQLLKPFGAFWSPLPLGAVWETAGKGLGDGWETAGRGLEGVWETSGSRLGEVWGTSGRRLGDVWAHTGGRSWRRRRAQVRRAVVVVGRGGAAGGVAPGSQRFPQEGSLQLSRVGASARQGRRSFRFTPIPAGDLLVKNCSFPDNR